MKLEDFGYNEQFEQFRVEHKLDGFLTGRIISEHKERYIVKSADCVFEAEITGNLRFGAKSREDFPAVGDWVAMSAYDSDFAFLVQAVDRDFNINRLERYLTICNVSGIKPVIVLTKTDLADEQSVNENIAAIKTRIKQVPVLAISNATLNGYDEIKAFIKKGKTYCLLGSSGVGKSTLLNNLTGKATMRTDTISESTSKGRHVTSHRELTVLENGGILIDNPGMREVGIADAKTGLEQTFDYILQLTISCKFKNCTHVHEAGCAVIEAVENGGIDQAAYKNYLKLEREQAHFESTAAERRKKDKEFGKMVKNYKNNTKKNKY